MWMPVLLMNAIIIVVTVLIIVADRFLVTYGECRIRIRRGAQSREFTVTGGGTLLAALIDQHVEIPSSCGGKGSCGYCKCRVVSGGGQLLPTEELFMTRADKADHLRLACQVKVKGDLEVEVPDFLAVVRAMVAGKKFDARKRWRVTIR